MKKTLVILTRWGLSIGLIILALVIVGEILRRRAWEDVADIPAPAPPPAPPAPRTPAPPAVATPAAPAGEPATTAKARITPAPGDMPGAASAPAPATMAESAATAEPTDGACPATHPVKGNIRTHDGEEDRIYHLPGSQYYERTRAEVCFRTEADAAASGFRAPRPG